MLTGVVEFKAKTSILDRILNAKQLAGAGISFLTQGSGRLTGVCFVAENLDRDVLSRAAFGSAQDKLRDRVMTIFLMLRYIRARQVLPALVKRRLEERSLLTRA